MSERGVQGTSRELVRALAAGVLVLLVLVAAAFYYRVGWWRMEAACATNSTVAYGWSWQPPGFQCTYDNGETETSLWF